MRAPLTGLAALAVASLLAVGPHHGAEAAGDKPPTPPTTSSGGASFDVSAQLAGRYQPGGDINANPCPEGQTPLSQGLEDQTGNIVTRTAPDGTIERRWAIFCIDPADGSRVTLYEAFWIGLPTPAALVADLMAILPGYLDPPTVEWPNMSPEHGWLFVKVPMDFRINNLNPITITATVDNGVGDTASASATATPDTVTFVSGEGASASCTAEQATAVYIHATTDACEYTYDNSSSIAGGTFDTTTTMEWAITSTPPDPTIPATLDTFVGQALGVSEVQAIVTCYGDNC